MGRSVLQEEGLGALTFKRVFDRLNERRGVRLTNASVIRRVWRDQADFRADVLVAVALDENENEVDRTLQAVRGVLEEIDRTTPEARLRKPCASCAGSAGPPICRSCGSRPIGRYGSAHGDWWPPPSEPRDYRERIEHAVVAGYDAFNERIEEVYLAMTSYLGFRLRQPLTLRQFTIAADSLGQGCGLRDRFDSTPNGRDPPPHRPHGELQEWTLFAIGFHGLVTQFFELDPDWQGGVSGSQGTG